MSLSLSADQMMKLMAYADGELDAQERADAEALMAKDGDASRFVSQLVGLGNVAVALHEDRDGKTIAKLDLADAIMAKVHAEPAAARKAAEQKASKPSSLDEARARRASRLKVGGGVVAALALAAAVFLVAREKETPMAKAPVAPSSAVAPSENGAGVEVEAAFGTGHSVSVYYLPSSNELSTSVVVWVDETGEK